MHLWPARTRFGINQRVRASPQKDRNKIREFVGVQLQESALPPRIKVGEAVRLFASFYSNPLDPGQLLESLGIDAIVNSSFKNLSGGQKQRVSIALALVGNPRLASSTS